MADDWDHQRDIEAEGQRATMLSDPSRGRLIGRAPNGMRVNNVNTRNRFDIDPKNPTRKILILSEDRKRVVRGVFIPNERGFPDVVMVDGRPHVLVNTKGTPQYAECHSTSTVTPTQPNVKDENNG